MQLFTYQKVKVILEAASNYNQTENKYRRKPTSQKNIKKEKGTTTEECKQNEKADYLNNKLESTSYICIAADNDHNVDIADSHIKERATTNLSHRTCTKFFCLHYMDSESINHIPPEMKYRSWYVENHKPKPWKTSLLHWGQETNQ